MAKNPKVVNIGAVKEDGSIVTVKVDADFPYLNVKWEAALVADNTNGITKGRVIRAYVKLPGDRKAYMTSLGQAVVGDRNVRTRRVDTSVWDYTKGNIKVTGDSKFEPYILSDGPRGRKPGSVVAKAVDNAKVNAKDLKAAKTLNVPAEVWTEAMAEAAKSFIGSSKTLEVKKNGSVVFSK